MEPHLLLIGGAGYIGSYILPRLKADGFDVDVCDLGLRGYPHGPVLHTCDYIGLDREALALYSHIVWFGGHSSVTAAVNDPYGALANNCLNLVTLRANARPDARLIYASSASLYSTSPICNSDAPLWSIEDQDLVVNINAYDMSKFVFDYIAKCFLKNFVGLRLGTVSGWSSNLRPELLFNAMNISAISSGKVRLGNPDAFRSILFLDDLYSVVRACILSRHIADGFFNVASATASIGEFARAVAGFHNAELEMLPPSPTYSFRLDTKKAEAQLNVRFNGDLIDRFKQFVEDTMKADASRTGHQSERGKKSAAWSVTATPYRRFSILGASLLQTIFWINTTTLLRSIRWLWAAVPNAAMANYFTSSRRKRCSAITCMPVARAGRWRDISTGSPPR